MSSDPELPGADLLFLPRALAGPSHVCPAELFLRLSLDFLPFRLVSKGRNEQARDVLARRHTETFDRDHPIVNFQMAEIEQAIQNDKTEKTSWLSLLAAPGNRKRLRVIVAIAFLSQWSYVLLVLWCQVAPSLKRLLVSRSGNGPVSYAPLTHSLSYQLDLPPDLFSSSQTVPQLISDRHSEQRRHPVSGGSTGVQRRLAIL